MREAKSRFSALIEQVQLSPQRVKKHRRDALLVMSAAEYDRLKPAGKPRKRLIDALQASGLSAVDVTRGDSFSRDVDL